MFMDLMVASFEDKVSSRKSYEQDNKVSHMGLEMISSSSIDEGTGLGSTEELRTT